jgi:hypothetical protein
MRLMEQPVVPKITTSSASSDRVAAMGNGFFFIIVKVQSAGKRSQREFWATQS